MAGRAKASAPKRPFRNQKKQTTLQFSPLPSSSPGKDNYGKAVQDRLVSARYGTDRGLPHNINDARSETGETQTLPTPEPSSQLQNEDQSESQMIDDPVERHEVNRNCLGATLTPLHTSSPSSPVRTQIDDESDEDDLISSVQKRRKILSAMSSGPAFSSTRRSARLHPGSPSQRDEQNSPLTRRSGRLRRKSIPRYVQSSPSDSSHTVASVEIRTPTRQPSSRFSDIGSPESSDEGDAIMASRPTASRRKSSATKKDPFIVNDDEIQYVSDDEVPHPRTRRGRKKIRGDVFVVDDGEVEYLSDDDDDAVKEQPRKSRKFSTSHKSPRTPRRRSKEEQDELDEDLRDLQNSDQEGSVIQTRTRGGPVTTQRDEAREHFDLLKRRRAGEKIPRVEDSEEEEEISDAGADIDFIRYPRYDVSDPGSAHSSIDTDQEPEDEQVGDDEDFVVEDSTGRLGRPHPDIPLQFTSFASAKPRELFPHIIEWLVKNKIAPAFSRNDELYNLAFDRVDDQVKAQAGSRLISAAWGTEFKRAILARPNMKVMALPGSAEDNIRDCDACNRTNHPAQYEFVFSGQPYYKKTLEPVDNSDDDEGDGYDDDVSRDENGHALPSQDQRFYLGRFCAANAEMGHKLTHWKYHLNDSLMTYLDMQGVLSAEAIVARDKMNKKKREREAENIVDNMQETGVIGEFWAEFENDLNDARLGMEDYDKRGSRLQRTRWRH
ncbi:uncharacterized protein Z518_03269 [Rhinocladiella mackenziei CBS 650.93]|uniref:DUF4211 domain-containing protein n=1 Tax=Rhinocladiella mackenziei CBS 650.93 TaxID=1442369 RepID=A0A0D2HDK5_9EURO|nr:uncharacterized protein Z518_03269 [Rhinocladiella mackenziei CBS 650.93]KIX08613.1 hypothetical protein Z518_03269 [Rhinocladiella mackenziei CBS 650.93]